MQCLYTQHNSCVCVCLSSYVTSVLPQLNSRHDGRAYYSLGGACGHIKAHGLSLFPHQRKLCTEGLLGRHALGRILMCTLYNVCQRSTHVDAWLFLVVLLLVHVNEALPVDLELGALGDLAYGITKLLLANALLMNGKL